MIDLVRAAQDQARHYEHQRDALQSQLDQARRENAHLRAVNAVLLRIFADALGRTLPETTPTEGDPAEVSDVDICEGCSALARPRVITRPECEAGLRRVAGIDEPQPVDEPASRGAACPVGECGHPGTSHEAEQYAPDGTPVRPICCAGDCRCGQQWRNT